MTKITAPLITVIIPAFNAQATIERSVKSALNQTHGSVELIVVNDCSTDKTSLLLQNLKKEARNLRVINNKFNKGTSAARNQGIDAAMGEWITFLDADDYFDLKYLEAVRDHLQKQEFICTSYVEIGTSNEKKFRNHQLVANTNLYDEALLNYLELYYLKPYQNTAFVHCWNKFFLKSLIDEQALRFNESLSQLEDVDFVFRFLCHAEQRQYVNIPGIYHRVDKLGSSLSNHSGLEENSSQKLVVALNAPMKFKKNCFQDVTEWNWSHLNTFFVQWWYFFALGFPVKFGKGAISHYFGVCGACSHTLRPRNLPVIFVMWRGESKVFNIAFRYFPAAISSVFLILMRR